MHASHCRGYKNGQAEAHREEKKDSETRSETNDPDALEPTAGTSSEWSRALTAQPHIDLYRQLYRQYTTVYRYRQYTDYLTSWESWDGEKEYV